MYVCGPTVYDLLHVGNFRGAIFFNLLSNFLRKKGLDVNFVYNFTDVDDKIIKKAQEVNKDPLFVSEHFISEFKNDFNSLGLTAHTFNPKVSEFIPEMISYIEDIFSKGLAYKTKDGSVYLRRHKLGDKGPLSGRDINEGLTGEKNSLDEKEHESDFALWKGAKEGEISWASPWGQGRPGWHLECSVMIHEIFLGETLDIHGGGIDLLFPHHENEMHQCCAHGQKTLANFWVHNNLLNMGSQKMSKSLGNVLTGRSFIEDHSAEVLKFIILSHHYRSVIDFSPEQIERFTNQLGRLYQVLARAKSLKEDNQDENLFSDIKTKFFEALEDDLNTPVAFSYLFEAVSKFNKSPVKHAKALYKLFTQDVGPMMALFQEDAFNYNRYLTNKALQKLNISEVEIDEIIEARHIFRGMKDYESSDRLRKELVDRGINLLDLPGGRTDWEVIR